MKYFTIQELTESQQAKELGIENIPDKNSISNLKILVERVLDPAREKYGKPIFVNSGYRSEELNDAVRGAKNSQHLKGEAVDITTGSFGGNKILFDILKNLCFDQLIDEKNLSWIHVSYSKNNRNQILKLQL